ncbi:MAG TPA: anthranilate synthase component I, partial [Pirellulales bacterium]|nr:anthranilate synthase component I [Pirellulales bacterium]
MTHCPDFETFCRLAGGADLVPVYRQLAGDMLTPVTAFRKLDSGASSCLFESVIGGEKVGRYSFLAGDPYLLLEARGHRVTVTTVSPLGPAQKQEFDSPDPLEELRRRIGAVRAAALPELPPFCGGAVGYAGYDTVRYSEHLPDAPADDRHLPDLAFAFFDHMVVFDNVRKTMLVVAMARISGEASALATEYSAACGRVDQLVSRLGSPEGKLCLADIELSGDPHVSYRSNFDR